MNFVPYRDKVQAWFESYARQKPDVSKEEVLKVQNLHFAYGDREPVLSDISFSVHKGEMLAIIGKNGAGKTTLSNLICGFLKPDAGEIYLNGQDISPLSIKERGEKIGLVMQHPNQMISKTIIFEEVALGLAVRGVPEDEIKERVNETLKICGLYPFRNWPVSALSFGQKKRVTIASILVMQPEIMILDEPTAGQDYHHYTEIMEFIKQINEKYGITIIMITHDMHLMLEYTNRSIVLADGRLLSVDTPAAILTDEALAGRANLKKTSLYDMALACGIEQTSEFVEHFISYERAYVRGAGEPAGVSKDEVTA
jgi:energy-coupling factor transport system ATP-binding protein